MSKTCEAACIGICDFCRLYNFNGDEKGVYVQAGYCVFHEKAKDPEDGCNDFICKSYKKIKKGD